MTWSILCSVGAFAFAVIALRAYSVDAPWPFDARWFVGPDSYMRMVRVLDWWNGNSWYETVSLRTNWPYGEIQHWTRPLDLLMVLLTLPLLPFMDFDSALFAVGVGISPLISIVAMAVLVWGTRGLLDLRGQAMLMVLFAFQPITRAYFLAARPDHHSLILLAFCIVLAVLLRLAQCSDHDRKLPALAGASSAFGIWVSIEGLTTNLFALICLALPWLISGDQRWLNSLRRFAIISTLSLTIMLGIERPPSEWLTAEEYDRLSMVHVTVLALIGLGVEWMWRTQSHTQSKNLSRWGYSIASAILAAGILVLLFPDFFKGPFGAAMDPRIQEFWLDRVGELQPLVGSDWKTNIGGILVLGPVVWLLVWFKIRCDQYTQSKTFDHTALVIAVSSLLFFPMAMLQMRWGAYFGVTVSIAWAALFQRTLDWQGGPKVGTDPGTPILRIPAVLGLLFLPVLVATILSLISPTKPPPRPQNCKWRDLQPTLMSEAFGGGRPQVILSHIHQGPEILYRTPHRVIGSPYHRNADGILDAYTFVTTQDSTQARTILEQRGVDFVILCVDSREERKALDVEGPIMMRKFIDETHPKWLIPIDLGKELNDDFRAYRFVKTP
ncbi:MAG: hypothetical protein OQK24_08885 [Magnetovibrio sp.]|nr:hypothetical protein [Magnetovibrio sp.]